MHLAELNVGRLVAPTDDPQVADFMNNLDKINGMGKRMPGFVWMMEGAGEPGTGNTAAKIGGDPLFVSNLTVWEDFESLSTFVYKTLGWLPQPDGRNRDGGHHRRAKLVYVYGHRGGDCAAMGLCLGFHVGGHGADPDAGISAQGQGRHQPNTRQTQAMRFPAGREFALGTKGLQALLHTA